MFVAVSFSPPAVHRGPDTPGNGTRVPGYTIRAGPDALHDSGGRTRYRDALHDAGAHPAAGQAAKQASRAGNTVERRKVKGPTQGVAAPRRRPSDLVAPAPRRAPRRAPSELSRQAPAS